MSTRDECSRPLPARSSSSTNRATRHGSPAGRATRFRPGPPERLWQAYSDWQYIDWWAVVRRQPLSQFGYCVTVPCGRALSDATQEPLAAAACMLLLLFMLFVLLRFTIARRWGHARPQGAKAPNALMWACALPSGPASPVGVESLLNLVTASRRLSCEENERAPLLGSGSPVFTRAHRV